METIRPPLAVVLGRSQFLRLAEPAGVCLQVVRGTLWVTVDGRPADVELGPGGRWCFDGAAPALIGTLGGPAEFRAERPASTAPLELAWR
jgi:hypothetical protein